MNNRSKSIFSILFSMLVLAGGIWTIVSLTNRKKTTGITPRVEKKISVPVKIVNLNKHDYKKYWEIYSFEQLKDTLFSDTLMMSGDPAGDRSPVLFYINAINELLADLKDDWNKTDSLFPAADFNKVRITDLWSDDAYYLTYEQIPRFLSIINNPVSFIWSETTYEDRFQVEFFNDDKVVREMILGESNSGLKMTPDWPQFKKMKFGCFKPEAYEEIKKLLKEVGFENIE